MPYHQIDEYNIIIDSKYVLLSPFGDRKKKDCNRHITICLYHIFNKSFELFDVLKDSITNHQIIPVEPLLQHIDFTNEIKGKTPFTYYPEISALSLKLRKKTLVKCPRHLWCKQVHYGIWIRKEP